VIEAEKATYTVKADVRAAGGVAVGILRSVPSERGRVACSPCGRSPSQMTGRMPSCRVTSHASAVSIPPISSSRSPKTTTRTGLSASAGPVFDWRAYRDVAMALTTRLTRAFGIVGPAGGGANTVRPGGMA
jgi:hypothetical protein